MPVDAAGGAPDPTSVPKIPSATAAIIARQSAEQEPRPPVASLRRFLETSPAHASSRGKLAEANRYALNRSDGLCPFLDDGRVGIDSNTDERSIRPLALNRKSTLCAGCDQGGEHWAGSASLVETCNLNRLEPEAWLVDALSRLAARHA